MTDILPWLAMTPLALLILIFILTYEAVQAVLGFIIASSISALMILGFIWGLTEVLK